MKKGIKLLLSVAILVFLYNLVESEAVIKGFQAISWYFLLIIVVGYALGQALSAYKWHLILLEAGLAGRFIKSISSYFTGMFVNSFGLGIVGGDLARGLLVAPKNKKLASVATVFVDRLHGLITLAVIAGVSACFFESKLPALFLIAMALGVGAAILAWAYAPRVIQFLKNKSDKFSQKLKLAAEVLPRSLRGVSVITVLSFLFHIWQILLHYLMAQFLGWDIPFVALLVSVPFVNILTSLPISWNGLGVREAAYIYFLDRYLIFEEALILGAIWFVAAALNSFAGGVVAFSVGNIRS